MTLPFVLALTSAATFLSAGSVALTRGGAEVTTGARPPLAAAQAVAIERLIPRNVVAFARVTIDPEGAERAAVARLLGPIPPAARASGLNELDRRIGEILPLPVDLRTMRRALGRRIAVAVVVVNRRPEKVTILELRDPARAARQIRTSLQRGQELVLDGDVGYAGSRRAIASLRASAKLRSMATHETYLRELGALGGSGLAVGWFDGSRLSAVRDRDLPEFLVRQRDAPEEVPDLRKSTAVAVAYVRGATVVFEMRESGAVATMLPKRATPLVLLGNAPGRAGMAFGLTDPATYLRIALGTLTPGGGFTPPGVDLEQDVFAWLGDEITFALLPGGDIGAAVRLKDAAAFERAFGKLSIFLRAQGGFDGDAGGFTMTQDGRTVVMRRSRGIVAIGFAPEESAADRIAQDLISGSGSTLSRDAAYRSMFGTAPSTMRMFVRADPKTPGLGGFFVASAEPFLRHVEAIGYEVRTDGDASLSRLILAFER